MRVGELAATAPPEKRGAYHKMLAGSPMPAIRDRILSAEGLDTDPALHGKGEIAAMLERGGR